jgi:chromosome segregation ATPase
MNWMLIVPMLAFALLALALGLAAHRNHLAMEAMASRKQKIIDAVTKERYKAQTQCKIAQEQRDRLNRENDALHKHFEIMKESLDVAQAEVERLQKSADHATIPLAEVPSALANVAIDKPEPPKRPPRKKAGTP